jgi:hypothetical protein
MNETRLIWRFCLAALAVWRLTHFLAEEDGPWDVIARFRARLGSSVFGRLMDCFYCVSLWVSVPLAVWLSDGWIGILIHWQALSGAACLFQRATDVSEPIFPRIETTFEGDESCAVVKSEAH